MLSQKELGSLATVYFSNLPLASHYGFNSFDLLVKMIELMKRIGEVQKEFSGYNTDIEFKTPDNYQQTYAFLDECKSKFPTQVSLFIKDTINDNKIQEALKQYGMAFAIKLYAFMQEWAVCYVRHNDEETLKEVLDWIKKSYNVSFGHGVNEYLMGIIIKDLFQEMENLGWLELDRF